MSRWQQGLETLAGPWGRYVIAVAAVLTIYFGVGYASLPFSNDPDVITLEGSDELSFYREFLERWGSDELIVLAYDVPDAFDPQALRTLRSLTDDLLRIPEVRWVWSLDTAFRVDVGPFGPYARPLVPDRITRDPAIREAALSSPFVRDALVSSDGRTLVLSVQLEGTELDNSEIERRALAAIDELLGRPRYASLGLHVAGAPVFNRALTALNQRDNALFTPLTVAIITLLVLALFRSVLAGVTVLALIGVSVVWTLGSMSWAGVPMNITTSLLPPLLMVIAVADSIHILNGYLDRLTSGETRAAALRWTLREIVPSCFWTSATTAFGFASLLLVQIESVRSFSLFAMLGVAIAFVLAVTLLPALLVRIPLERTARRRAARRHPSRSTWTHPRPLPALLLVCVAIGLGITGPAHLEVATHDGEFFAPDHSLNRAYRFIESRLQGVTPFEIEIRAPEGETLRRARALRNVATLQQKLGEIPELTSGLSYVQLLESTSPGLDLSNEDAVQRALFLLETLAPDDLGAWVRQDYRIARISARADAMTSARSVEILEGVRERADAIFPPGFSVRPTGLVPVFSQMEQYLVEGQIRSYGFAVLAIALAFLLIYRSLRVVAVALVPNLVPVLIAVGVMGLGGIRLDVVTVMVASVALGIIVDDTIHLTSAYLRGLEAGRSPEAALGDAMRVAGRPIVFTSLILVGGFSVLALSDFQPTAHFGIMVGLTVATALLADLVILPAALIAFVRERPTAAVPLEEVVD
ncbi:MAG: RND family transporter [Myxococcota bacterium]